MLVLDRGRVSLLGTPMATGERLLTRLLENLIWLQPVAVKLANTGYQIE